MPMLIPVQYHSRNYPKHIKPNIVEVAGHFDTDKINTKGEFSLHTEYSYGKRKFNSTIIQRYHHLMSAHKNFVPQLWYSKEWVEEFVEFIKTLCNENSPKIIEIHPPFSDYAKTIEDFLNIYEIFEDNILSHFPNCKVLIENRYGSIYRGGKFLVSKGRELRELCDNIAKRQLKLRLALDIPQLLSAYGGPEKLNINKLSQILERNTCLNEYTESIHLWGKRKSQSGRNVAHCGDFSSYFGSIDKKNTFLDWLISFLDDDKLRYFVPEVNSSDEDLHSIVGDLENAGIRFV